MDFGDFAGEGSVGDEDNGTNLDGLGESSVGAGNAGVVTFDGVVGDNLQGLARDELHGCVVLQEACTDLGTLSVEHDGTILVWALLQGLAQVCDAFAVRLKFERVRRMMGNLPRDLRGRN